jgi:hypothetical protein
VHINPSTQAADAWTVTANGAIAIVRGHDYHADYIDADGTKRSGPKLPFDWRRITESDKQARVDSARRVVDSLTTLGGYRLQACASGNMTFNTMPPKSAPTGASGNGRGSGSGSGGATGGGGASGVGALGGGMVPTIASSDGGRPECQTVTVAAEFAPLSEMADYVPPIRESAVQADLDGNIWILPSTSLAAKGGLLYDVVNSRGELTERVQLPAGRTVAGFGKGGTVFLLLHNTAGTGVTLEKVKITP